MSTSTSRDVVLSRDELAGRTFLLGNQQAMSLSLPATNGYTDRSLHPHKWFGVYMYGRKFLEAQLVYGMGSHRRLLCRRNQVGLTIGLTDARRDYVIDGTHCTEEYFIPNGVDGMCSTVTGALQFVVEPEFDMRFYRALNHTTEGYAVEACGNAFVVSHAQPNGTYDDATETFTATPRDDDPRLFAAIGILADSATMLLLPKQSRNRRKAFRQDRQRYRYVQQFDQESHDGDHAPMWNQSTSLTFAPVRISFSGHGTVLYGFGNSDAEAVASLEHIRADLPAMMAQKQRFANRTLVRAELQTGNEHVDRAATHVLSRLMDGLVVRNVATQDTALQKPATMILAGNQYFHDSWKRDENIALGFLLSLGFHDLARDIIRDTWQLQDTVTGRLPQRIRAGEEPPYHSSDGTLWALWRLQQYWRSTGDSTLVEEKLPMVEHFFRTSLARTVHGLLPSGRTSSPEYLWETWMDTPHTPRDGFPIEIQMLWIACLREWSPHFEATPDDLAQSMRITHATAMESLSRFMVRGVLADSLDADLNVRNLTTPNPYFCFGLDIDLGVDLEGVMRRVGRSQLAGKQGIATLAPQDWGRVFDKTFLDDPRAVRGKRMRSIGKFNYHRGVEWNWLSQLFVRGELKYGDAEAAFRIYLERQVHAVLGSAGVGGLSELYDLSGPRGPDFQAWSMSGFLEAVHAFLGVRIDVPRRTIDLFPQTPDSWPFLRARKWFGEHAFDVAFSRSTKALELDIAFVDRHPINVVVQLALLVPQDRVPFDVSVVIDSQEQDSQYTIDTLKGTRRRVLRLHFPAARHMVISLPLRPRSANIPRSAGRA